MSMPTQEDVKNFFRTLILGEFEDKWRESSAAIIVRGLIGIIPGIDQVLDIQDTIGLIYRFEKKNWQLTTDDYADLAFATIGWFPSLGSPVKAALKPIWKNRRNAARGVRNGVAMLERSLGYKHGAYIRTMRDFVKNIQKWNQAINNAIAKMREAINVYLQILHSVAKGSLTFRPIESWKWTYTIHFPNSLVNLAKQQIPATQQFQRIMADAIRQGSETVRLFLQELLGEHALVVADAERGAASHTRKNQNYRPIAMAMATQKADNQRDKRSASLGKNPQPTMKNGQPVQNVATNKGGRSHAVQKTGEGLVGNALTGIVGEHMADYWMAKQLGLNPSHDSGKAVLGGLRKLNYGGKLYQLHVPSANPKGIDSLWKVDGKIGGKPYCIVEAKASATELTKSLSSLLTDGRDKTERRTAQSQQQLQMSRAWCEDKLKQLGVHSKVGTAYSRRVVFFGMDKIKGHLAAYGELIKILAEGKKEYELKTVMNRHKDHEPSRIFTDAEIDALISKRTGESGKSSTQNRQRKVKK
ncbi:hypothetical protein MIS46_09980 [Wielerella bovis]|uniref:hypothetical protein n=1 Tax=Wielerella bovis TaxID=2917790 RepID=UPI0020199CBC|nr:hypothetical protein [Wielerella bovis]ULJ62275.1 hypothetical protein MIS46_09980 [Wielerella bovis]